MRWTHGTTEASPCREASRVSAILNLGECAHTTRYDLLVRAREPGLRQILRSLIPPLLTDNSRGVPRHNIEAVSRSCKAISRVYARFTYLALTHGKAHQAQNGTPSIFHITLSQDAKTVDIEWMEVCTTFM